MTGLLALGAGLIGPMTFVAPRGSGLHIRDAWFWFTLLASALFWWNLSPQMRFVKRMKKLNWGADLLSAPIPDSSYAGTFLRLFLATVIQSTVIHVLYLTGNGQGPYWANQLDWWKDFALDICYVDGMLLLTWWGVYWCSIAAPRLLMPLGTLLGGYLLVYYGLTTELSSYSTARMPPRILSLVYSFFPEMLVFWTVVGGGFGVAGYVRCRLHYTDRLRKELFS